MAYTAQNSSKINLQRNLQIMNSNTIFFLIKKIANFINNQLEYFFFFFFKSKKKNL